VKELYQKWFEGSTSVHKDLAAIHQELAELRASLAKEQTENRSLRAKLESANGRLPASVPVSK
jgi:uncharacterized membrane protein